MEQFKLPLGDYIETFVDWLVDNGASFFDAISESLEWMIALFTDALLWFHPIAFITLTVAIVLYFRRYHKGRAFRCIFLCHCEENSSFSVAISSLKEITSFHS